MHKRIGDVIQEGGFRDCKIVRSSECGGKQDIPMFCSDEKSNETKYCNVDLLILKDNKIRTIIEIEETDIKPTQICGKFLTSALSSYFIHKSENDIPLGMGDSVLFIQIVNTSQLKEKSTKVKQFENVEKSIMNILPIKGSKIGKYKLLYGTISDFGNRKGNKCAELITYIKEALK